MNPFLDASSGSRAIHGSCIFFLFTSFHFLSLFSDLLAIFHPHLSLCHVYLLDTGAFSFSLYGLSALPVLNCITAPPPLSLLLAATHFRRNNISTSEPSTLPSHQVRFGRPSAL